MIAVDHIGIRARDAAASARFLAEVLGLERSHLYRKMKTLGIAVKE